MLFVKGRRGGGSQCSTSTKSVESNTSKKKTHSEEDKEDASFCSASSASFTSASHAPAALAVVTASPPPSPPQLALPSASGATKATGGATVLHVTKVRTQDNLVVLSNGETWRAPAIAIIEPKSDGDPPVTRNTILSTSTLSIEFTLLRADLLTQPSLPPLLLSPFIDLLVPSLWFVGISSQSCKRCTTSRSDMRITHLSGSSLCGHGRSCSSSSQSHSSSSLSTVPPGAR